MNHLTIIGNLCNDPVSRQTPGGSTVCNFTVAVNRRKSKKGDQEADFFRVAAWNELADVCQKYLVKGRKVAVNGSVSASCYTPQNGGEARAQLEVRAQDVEFLGSRDASDHPNDGGRPAAVPAAPDASGFAAVETDELPF